MIIRSRRAVGAITAVGVATLALTATLAGPAAASSAETVYSSDVGPSLAWHTADTRPGGTVEFSDLYGGALGSGALVFSTETSSAKAQLFTSLLDGTRVDEIESLAYATFQDAEAPVVALPAINLRVDGDADGDVDFYLVYEPYQDQGNAAVLGGAGAWQSWDAWRDGDAKWWRSHQSTGLCSQSQECTITQLLGLYPDATIRDGGNDLRGGSTPADADFQGSFGLNQGSGNANTLAAADALHVSTATGVDVTFDFEPEVVLAGKNDCKKGGWSTSTSPVFANQGDCVSFFASSGKSKN